MAIKIAEFEVIDFRDMIDGDVCRGDGGRCGCFGGADGSGRCGLQEGIVWKPLCGVVLFRTRVKIDGLLGVDFAKQAW